ncbi:putative F420-0 ABC transporter substrate-binding protein [Paraoerskovia marina]|uniref:putative F420-0 ABC transporter substrate-binding protein n=1 Tax=Paraoerskovia marina TaxID=545619 RepID=UPI0005B95242|nr:putative F420-0 ABC transporter substrate-binding protein [Paraoerskovia marina]
MRHVRPRTPARPRRAPRAVAALTTATALLGLGACADPDPGAGTDPTDGSTAAVTDGFPVDVDNCGFDVTIAAEPQRVVTIKSSMTELALALGAGDRIVGSAFLDGPLPDDLAAGAPETVTSPMADQAPGAEALLALEPDLVLAGWESTLTAEESGDRSTLTSLDVATYVAPSACKEKEYQPDPMTFDLLFDQIAEAGDVLGTPDEAAALVDEQSAELDAVVPDERGLTAVWYSSGSDVPYVGAGIGTPQMIMSAAGLTNIAADVHDTWTSMGWESIVEQDPDVIVLVDAAWNTAESKIEALEANPATAELSAVREGRYVTLPFASTEAGVRSVDAVASLVEQLGSVTD